MYFFGSTDIHISDKSSQCKEIFVVQPSSWAETDMKRAIRTGKETFFSEMSRYESLIVTQTEHSSVLKRRYNAFGRCSSL